MDAVTASAFLREVSSIGDLLGVIGAGPRKAAERQQNGGNGPAPGPNPPTIDHQSPSKSFPPRDGIGYTENATEIAAPASAGKDAS
jgi:hypothetical protein